MSDVADHTDTAEAETPIRLGSRRPRVMAQSAVLGEEGSPRLFRRAAAIVCTAALALVAWAAFITVDETITVAGTVVPGPGVAALRHPDGGTVTEVMVKNGDKVEPGQVLLRLAPGQSREELEQLKVRRAGVGLMAAGLKALAGGKQPDYAFALPEFQDMVEKEKAVFESLKDISERQRRAAETQIRTSKAALEDIQKRQAALSKRTDILEEELQFREELFKKGLTDKGVYTATKEQVEKAYKELADLTAERQRVGKALADAEGRLHAFDVRLRGKVVSELLIVDPALEKLDQTYKQLSDRVERLTVSAPAGGIVRAARIPAVGATLEPGAELLEIVPEGGKTAVEAKIPATELGRVAVGASVTVTAAAGGVAGIPGRVSEISKTPVTDDKGRSYHKAKITVVGDPMKPSPSVQRLTPGTDVEARVRIGSRPLYAHLWRKLAGA